MPAATELLLQQTAPIIDRGVIHQLDDMARSPLDTLSTNLAKVASPDIQGISDLPLMTDILFSSGTQFVISRFADQSVTLRAISDVPSLEGKVVEVTLSPEGDKLFDRELENETMRSFQITITPEDESQPTRGIMLSLHNESGATAVSALEVEYGEDITGENHGTRRISVEQFDSIYSAFNAITAHLLPQLEQPATPAEAPIVRRDVVTVSQRINVFLEHEAELRLVDLKRRMPTVRDIAVAFLAERGITPENTAQQEYKTLLKRETNNLGSYVARAEKYGVRRDLVALRLKPNIEE